MAYYGRTSEPRYPHLLFCVVTEVERLTSLCTAFLFHSYPELEIDCRMDTPHQFLSCSYSKSEFTQLLDPVAFPKTPEHFGGAVAYIRIINEGAADPWIAN